MNTKKVLKQSVPHLGVFVFFFLIVLIYFYPAFDGKILQQGDINQFKGMSRELLEYDKPSGWTGSMFCGMPSYHITGYQTGIDFIAWIKAHILGAVQEETAGPVLMLLITAYILFLIMGAPWWLAAVGAIATGFSSYNIIIIVAGHVTKAWTLSFVPLVLSGMFLIFKRKYMSGFSIFALGLAWLIIANHLQITYYAAIFCFLLYLGFLVDRIFNKEWKQLCKVTGILTVGVVIAVLANLSNLYINYESGNESIRGKSELTSGSDAELPATNGLDKDYVFAWSYGKAETLSLLIPNVMGGNSGGFLGKDSHLYKELKAHGAQVTKDIQTYTYWGDKPFTSGPVYFGAIICFLFLFAFFIVPKNFKWWLLGITILFMALAWGKNLAWFNDFMYYHFPLYSKFRTVEMALVIPAFTFPILAVMALKELINNKTESFVLKKSLNWSAGVTAGICLILWVIPDVFFSFESLSDAQYGMPDWYIYALKEDRKVLLRSDALRSLIFIGLAAGLIWVYIRSKNRKKIIPYLIAGLFILILCDLWQVDKRYLNVDNFVGKKKYDEQLFSKSTADNFILQDTSFSYRVLNLNNPFQEARTSYYHKSIGGYHAAKLGRYQNLIDRRLSKEINSIIASFGTATAIEDLNKTLENCPSLNMLNAKYIIFNPEQPPLVNPYVNGNAWFVNSYRFVNSPDEEIEALETLQPKTEAVFDKIFESNIQSLRIIPDEKARLEMTAYYPNKVIYQSSSSQEGLAVFSEVYYKNGWKAFIDGKQTPISRADWILRAITIPAGDHQIEFIFDPDDVRLCGVVSTIFSGLLLLLIIVSLAGMVWKKENK
ncbi:MAG: hypothetical protein LBG15_13060 [Dysgonamonadaceae bacterium]|jgi:hypothetical protein|nr:hypothetical protein [Dysgonamonadaceae bacterium]